MIFKKNAYVFVNDTRLTSDKELLLNELASKNSKLVYMQQNRHNNMSGGTLICIPKQFFIVKPVVVYDNWDRFTLIAYVNEKGRQVLLGSIYMRPMFLRNEEAIDKQFDDLDNQLSS